MASKAFFHIDDAVSDYLKPNSAEADGCAEYFGGGTLDRNDPEQKTLLKGVVSGLKKIAAGIEADAGLRKRV